MQAMPGRAPQLCVVLPRGGCLCSGFTNWCSLVHNLYHVWVLIWEQITAYLCLRETGRAQIKDTVVSLWSKSRELMLNYLEFTNSWNVYLLGLWSRSGRLVSLRPEEKPASSRLFSISSGISNQQTYSDRRSASEQQGSRCNTRHYPDKTPEAAHHPQARWATSKRSVYLRKPSESKLIPQMMLSALPWRSVRWKIIRWTSTTWWISPSPWTMTSSAWGRSATAWQRRWAAPPATCGWALVHLWTSLCRPTCTSHLRRRWKTLATGTHENSNTLIWSKQEKKKNQWNDTDVDFSVRRSPHCAGDFTFCEDIAL